MSNKIKKLFLISGQVKTLFKENENPNSLKIAVDDISSILGTDWVLVGGLSLGYHADPRGTDDIDIMIYSEENLDNVKFSMARKFKRIAGRNHAVIHKDTGVEVEILTPEFLKIPSSIIKKAIEDAIVDDGLRIITKEGLVATKLCRGDFKDLGDIETLVKKYGQIDISGYELTDEQMELYNMVLRRTLR